MQIRLLMNVANDAKGAVLDMDEDRARRLIRTGYAEVTSVAQDGDVIPRAVTKRVKREWQHKA